MRAVQGVPTAANLKLYVYCIFKKKLTCIGERNKNPPGTKLAMQTIEAGEPVPESNRQECGKGLVLN